VWNAARTIGGAAFLLACLWAGFDQLAVRLTGEKTTGVVVDVDYGGSKHAHWRYPIGNGEYAEASENIMLFVPDIGSTGPVVYDPSDPAGRVVFGSIPSFFELVTLGALPLAALLGWAAYRGERPEPAPPAPSHGPPSPLRRAQAHAEDRRREAQRAGARQRAAQRRLRWRRHR
jgi:hypothetical protein